MTGYKRETERCKRCSILKFPPSISVELRDELIELWNPSWNVRLTEDDDHGRTEKRKKV